MSLLLVFFITAVVTVRVLLVVAIGILGVFGKHQLAGSHFLRMPGQPLSQSLPVFDDVERVEEQLVLREDRHQHRCELGLFRCALKLFVFVFVFVVFVERTLHDDVLVAVQHGVEVGTTAEDGERPLQTGVGLRGQRRNGRPLWEGVVASDAKEIGGECAGELEQRRVSAQQSIEEARVGTHRTQVPGESLQAGRMHTEQIAQCQHAHQREALHPGGRILGLLQLEVSLAEHCRGTRIGEVTRQSTGHGLHVQ
mmetsp:Transcript_13642/g.41160  ORF Transcript_13642/g.41160 Transcript_13642/m.41160 type:complete len:253 (-) Transcript_13642:700-1458(-)